MLAILRKIVSSAGVLWFAILAAGCVAVEIRKIRIGGREMTRPSLQLPLLMAVLLAGVAHGQDKPNILII